MSPCFLLFWSVYLATIPLEHTCVASLHLGGGCRKAKPPPRTLKNTHSTGIPNTSQFKVHFNTESAPSLSTRRDSAFISPNNGYQTSKTHKYDHKQSGFSRDSSLCSKSKMLHTEPDDPAEDMEEIKRYLSGSTQDDWFEEDPLISHELPEANMARETYVDDSNESMFVSPRPWSPGDDVKEPYMMDKAPKLAIDKWPENCFLRVKLHSYYKHLVNLAANRIKMGLENNPNLKVTNPMALPMRRKRWCYLSSVFIDKRSKDLIEIQEHTRVVDIVPVDNGSPRDFKGLLMVPMPNLVSFEYWFEEVHKPVKSRLIHDLYRKRRWISKHFLYHRDKHAKRELIEKLTSPELEKEIPLRWKRKRKADYYFLQLGELRKLYNSIIARKAEEDARRFYGVRMPEIWEIDDVRFIGNAEDRMYDPDYSNVDRLQEIEEEL